MTVSAETPKGSSTMNSFAMSAVGGFFFGVGMIVANFLMKSLVHIGICN